MAPPDSDSKQIIKDYLNRNFRIVTWPAAGDSKGPREEGWPNRQYTMADYIEGHRVGILLGTEVVAGKWLCDVDIDWSDGSVIAQKLLPPTDFIFGRNSKKVSHCFYTTPEPVASYRYEDIDKVCLIELRGTKGNGDVGFQTMVPPSIWSKDGLREPLVFLKKGDPGHLALASIIKQKTCLAAIGMILGRHLGKNGFGHDARLAWAGYLLRAGIPLEELITMGEAMSVVTNNLEVDDVRRVVESTAARLSSSGQKIKGGPALAKLLGDKGKFVIARINEWLGRDSDFIRSTDGIILKDSQENIRRAIAMFDIELSYDRFSERALVVEGGNPQLMTDEINDALWLRIDSDFRFRPTKQFYDTVIKNIVSQHKFHPVLDYLVTLRWDGIPRIDTWLIEYGGAPDTPYHRAISAIPLIAAVRRIRCPGCKYDEMLVLESDQGMNKSTMLRALCPKEEWFSDDLPLNIDAKQIIERTQGKWIIEASDLAGKRKAELEQLKAMLSRQIDGPARLAYAHFPIERPRQFIIIGTTNLEAYLLDATGARRFWPTKVEKFNVEKIRLDRDQLWAEAAHREEKGESIRLPERLWTVAESHQNERQETDAWDHIIQEGLDAIKPDGFGIKRITTNLLWELLQIDIPRRDRLGASRIADIMRRFGYRRTKVYFEGVTQAGYLKRGFAEQLGLPTEPDGSTEM